MNYYGDAAAFEMLQRNRHGLRDRVGRRVAHLGVAIVFVLLGQKQALKAQLLDHFNPLSGSANGIHLYGASFSTMYSAGPGAGSELGLPIGPLSGSRSITTLQGSAAFGLVRTLGRSSLSLTYSPSYVRGVSGTDYTSTNHALSLSMSRSLRAKWSVGGSAAGIMSDFNQLLFARSRAADIAAIPATFDEFAAALLTGRSTNPLLTQTVNAASVVGSPETAFLYGGRVLSLSLSASVTYAYSSRSSLSMTVSATRSQFFSRGSNEAGLGRNGFSVPWTTSGSPSINWGYSLTPRTTIGATLTTTRTASVYQDAYSHQATMSLGRTMSTRWFLQGTLGVGWIKPLRQTYQVMQGAQATYGASVGYKLYAHTFMASFNRSVSDPYGLGANGIESSTCVWAWKRPGRSISLTTHFGYSRLAGPIFLNSRSWTGSTSVGKALNSQMAISGSYSYVQFPTAVVSSTTDLTRSGLIVSLSWSPSARQ